MKKSKSSVAIFLIGILIISVGFMIQKHKNSFSTLATSQQSNLTEETSMLTVAFFFGNVFPYRKKRIILQSILHNAPNEQLARLSYLKTFVALYP